MSIGQELLDVPMGEMIRSMAFAIAEAQLKLDEASIETAEMMGGLKTIVGPDGTTTFEDSRVFFGHEWISYGDAVVRNTSVPDATLTNAITNAGTPPTTPPSAVTAFNAKEIPVPTRVSLLELGFAPIFYNFIDTIIEVKIAIKITQENSSEISTTDTSKDVQVSRAHRSIPFLRGSRTRTRNVSTSQVNATYSSKYSYSAEGSSLLRTKLVPVPTPAILEERIRALMDADRQRKLTGTQPAIVAPAVN